MSSTKRLKRNLDFVKVLCKANKCQREGICKGADRDLILCICECADNILRGNIPIKGTIKRKLSKHKKHLRELSDRKTKLKAKKQILVQHGGFLPLLLTPILSVAGSLLADVISNAINK